MATTDRFELTTWASGTDEFTREQMTDSHQNIEDKAALFLSGTTLPTVSSTDNPKAFFWKTDTSILYFRGTSTHAWEQIFPVVQTTALKADLQPLDGDLTALAALSTTGIISRTASDTYALRTIEVSGTGISISNGNGVSANPTITLASDASATANTIALRGASGVLSVGTPSSNEHATTKSYVDTADNLKANAADVYTKTNIHDAKLYQYANTGGGTGTALPSSGTRTTPRIYVQSTDPGTVGAITGDIWFQI